MKRVCGIGHGLLGYDLCGAANRFFNYAKTFVFTEVSVNDIKVSFFKLSIYSKNILVDQG